MLGAATAATLARYHFLHPILLAAAALLVSGTFWLAYRQRPDSLTPAERSTVRAIAWGGGTILAAFVLIARATSV